VSSHFRDRVIENPGMVTNSNSIRGFDPWAAAGRAGQATVRNTVRSIVRNIGAFASRTVVARRLLSTISPLLVLIGANPLPFGGRRR
jgi:hypothetical protein